MEWTLKARYLAKPHGEFRWATNQMTNWQRNQWAKSGYPGLRQKEEGKLRPFLAKQWRKVIR